MGDMDLQIGSLLRDSHKARCRNICTDRCAIGIPNPGWQFCCRDGPQKFL